MAVLHVSEETHQRLKVVAARRGCTLVALLAELADVAEGKLAPVRPTIGEIVQAAKESVGAAAPARSVVPIDTEGI